MEEIFRVVTNGGVTIGTDSTLILAANNNRSFAIISNDSDEAVYVSLGAVAIKNKGYRLSEIAAASDGTVFYINTNNLYKGAIYGICTSGSKNVCVIEGEDKYQ